MTAFMIREIDRPALILIDIQKGFDDFGCFWITCEYLCPCLLVYDKGFSETRFNPHTNLTVTILNKWLKG